MGTRAEADAQAKERIEKAARYVLLSVVPSEDQSEEAGEPMGTFEITATHPGVTGPMLLEGADAWGRHEAENCTELKAAHCPIHGPCACAPAKLYGDEGCPLHCRVSTHGLERALSGAGKASTTTEKVDQGQRFGCQACGMMVGRAVPPESPPCPKCSRPTKWEGIIVRPEVWERRIRGATQQIEGLLQELDALRERGLTLIRAARVAVEDLPLDTRDGLETATAELGELVEYEEPE